MLTPMEASDMGISIPLTGIYNLETSGNGRGLATAGFKRGLSRHF